MAFKKGDKVAVYSRTARHIETVEEVLASGSLRMLGDSLTTIGWHPKQCRKLVKKKAVTAKRDGVGVYSVCIGGHTFVVPKSTPWYKRLWAVMNTPISELLC